MRKIWLRVIGAAMALPLLGNAGPSPFGEAAIVIVLLEKLISSDAIDTTENGGPLTEWSNSGVFTVTKQLAGPDIGANPRISFIDRRDAKGPKLFMVVHRDGLGRLWARRAWQEVRSELCLPARQVSALDLDNAFSTSRGNARGQRCIAV